MDGVKISGYQGTKGFTMIEIVAVLLIVGIVSAVVVSRVTTVNQADLISQLEVVKGHLRYAQSRAMNSDTVWGIYFASATTYYLFQGDGSTTPVKLFGEENATVSLTAKGSSLTITPPEGKRVAFDRFGRPNPGIKENIVIKTSGSDIIVTKNTGFIP